MTKDELANLTERTTVFCFPVGVVTAVNPVQNSVVRKDELGIETNNAFNGPKYWSNELACAYLFLTEKEAAKHAINAFEAVAGQVQGNLAQIRKAQNDLALKYKIDMVNDLDIA